MHGDIDAKRKYNLDNNLVLGITPVSLGSKADCDIAQMTNSILILTDVESIA